MRKFLYAMVLGVSIAFGGCSSLGMGPIHRDTATVIKEDPAKAVQYGIDELNAGIAALATALIHDYQEGLYTKEEIKTYFDKLNRAVMVSNEAENFLTIGNVILAKDRLAIANAALAALQAELVKQKQKGVK